uniref:Uncharacterized protein n=1 Tax=Anguilla anguilla TaxID=7936 RepID=A0A0E9RHA1_ANGAN
MPYCDSGIPAAWWMLWYFLQIQRKRLTE